jgi:two-component system, NarL family, nitrate/nitrite response regulator NarL
MNVLAADDYILCCGLLRTLMLLYGDVRVTPANSIGEVLARIPELPDLDLVVLDTSMPGMETFAGLRRTVDMIPDVPVIVTSPTESRAQIIAAIRNGARGYIPLSSKPCVLQHALPLIMAGEFYIPASAVRSGTSHALQSSEGPAPGDSLTPRQREIAVMLAQGKSNKEIARELKVLEGTVKLHVKGILRKLGVRNRTEAVLAAARAGYLPKGILESGPSRLERTADDADQNMSGASASSPPSQCEAEDAPLRPALAPPVVPACSAFETDDAAKGLGTQRASSGRRAAAPQRARTR